MPDHEALAYERGYLDALNVAQANPGNVLVEMDATKDRIEKLKAGQILPRRWKEPRW